MAWYDSLLSAVLQKPEGTSGIAESLDLYNQQLPRRRAEAGIARPVGAEDLARQIAQAPVPGSTFSDPRRPEILEGLAGIDKALMEPSAPEQPAEPQGSPLRFSVGGKWYERAPGASGGTFETSPRQTDQGMAFDRGAAATPEDMAAVRRTVRSQGAFGSTAPLGPDRGPGGFSPSPRVEDVAVMPESAIEEQQKNVIAKTLAQTQSDVSEVADAEIPEELGHLRGLGLTRGEMRSLIAGMLTARKGTNKADALPMLQELNNRYQTELSGIRNNPQMSDEEKAQAEAQLTQAMIDTRKAWGFEAPQQTF